jgi:TPR repeat protein
MADSGDVKAQRRLAVLYSWTTNFNMATIHAYRAKIGAEDPPDVPRDDALAFKYARIASLNGDEVAQEVLAKAYACGLGTEKNLPQAYAWYSIATSQSALMLDTNDKPEELLRKRDYLSSQMSRDDIQRAKRLMINCYQSHYKTCD